MLLHALNPGHYLAVLGMLRIGGRVGWVDGHEALVEGLTEDMLIEAAMAYDPLALDDNYAAMPWAPYLSGGADCPALSRLGLVESHPLLGRLYAGRQTLRGIVLGLREALRPEDLVGLLPGHRAAPPARDVPSLRWDCTHSGRGWAYSASRPMAYRTLVGLDWLALMGVPVLYPAREMAPRSPTGEAEWGGLRYTTWRTPVPKWVAQSILHWPPDMPSPEPLTRWWAQASSLGSYHRALSAAAPERMVDHA